MSRGQLLFQGVSGFGIPVLDLVDGVNETPEKIFFKRPLERLVERLFERGRTKFRSSEYSREDCSNFEIPSRFQGAFT